MEMRLMSSTRGREVTWAAGKAVHRMALSRRDTPRDAHPRLYDPRASRTEITDPAEYKDYEDSYACSKYLRTVPKLDQSTDNLRLWLARAVSHSLSLRCVLAGAGALRCCSSRWCAEVAAAAAAGSAESCKLK